MLTADQLRAMARGRPPAGNLNSVLVAVNQYGPSLGLGQPHRLAHFLAQILHESGSFRYDKEIWGPTPAQKRYDTRTDLGNTPQVDGDGKLYSGRTAMQITGKANYRSFTEWAKKLDPSAPDFVAHPDKANTDPWEGLGSLWYWDDGNPERKSLNRYADQNNIEMVTRRINGGLNGYADRLDYYGRAALVLLGYATSKDEIERFQREHPRAGNPDGIVGQNTRMALHEALKGENPYREQVTVPVDRPVVPPEVETEVKQKTNWMTSIFGGGGLTAGVITFFADADPLTVGLVIGGGVLAAGIVLVGGVWIVRRLKAVRRELEAR